MGKPAQTIPSSFSSYQDGNSGLGKTPAYFQILAADGETNLLPEELYLVLMVNPQTMRITYQKNIPSVKTQGGYVEFHWGDGVTNIVLDHATGGFMRLTSGLSNKTGSSLVDTDQAKLGRRETLSYDSYMDMLALFKMNGATYARNGTIASQGFIKINFDGMTYTGWWDNFSVTDDVSRPYQFALSANFTSSKETMLYRTTLQSTQSGNFSNFPDSETADETIFTSFGRDRGTV